MKKGEMATGTAHLDKALHRGEARKGKEHYMLRLLPQKKLHSAGVYTKAGLSTSVAFSPVDIASPRLQVLWAVALLRTLQ